MSIRGAFLVLTTTAALALAACDAPAGAPPPAASSDSVADGAARRQSASADRGRRLFAAECAGCHGDRGRGDGPAAARLPVLPRNFTVEKFKYRSTDYGARPTRQDIFDTITAGLGGSGMPSFRFLTEAERWDLVEAVRAFAGLDKQDEGTPVPLGPETAGGSESVARGRKQYERLGCAACHGPEGRGDGPSAPTLKDDLQRPIKARDLTTVLRRGDSLPAIHRFTRTGLAGTPMPGFATQMTNEQGWDLTHYLVSMQAPEPPSPADPVALGRLVVARKHCDACHVIEGKGGRVGPSLDVAAGKLRYDWAKRFLKSPRPFGKIYPYIPYRMPDLGLTDAEIDGVLALFAQTSGRTYPEPAAEFKKIDGAHEDQGKLLFFLRCTECHNFGTVIGTPLAKQQGPDLIHLAERLRADWLPMWISDPKSLYPDTRMTNPGLKPDEVEAVREFIWNTSVEKGAQKP